MKKRILSALMALLLTATLPAAAFADDWYLENGDITVNAGDSGQTVTQGANIDVPDSAPVITQQDPGTPTTNTVTIDAAAGAEAKVTLDGVNIDTSTTGGAAVSTEGNGDVTVELDGSNTIQSGPDHAGLEKNSAGELTITDTDNDGSLVATGGFDGAGIGGGFNGSGSNITITGGTITAAGGNIGAGIGGGCSGSGINITITGGTVTATGGNGGAGIGGGYRGNGNNITITGGTVTATGGSMGAGIGGGYNAGGGNIKVWDDAQLKVQGGSAGVPAGTGAAIGNGGPYNGMGSEKIPGAEVTPNTEELTKDGKIEYYAPGVDMSSADSTNTIVGTHEHTWDEGKVTVEPTDTEKGEITYTCTAGNGFTKTEEIPALPAAITQSEDALSSPLYRVTDRDGKNISYKTEQNDGVLTITADADFAVLTGTLSGINTLKAQGVEKIVFVTNGATSTFALADLLAEGSMGNTYKLTHDGATVTFTLGATNADVSSILG